MLNAAPPPRPDGPPPVAGDRAGARRVLVLSGDILPYAGLPTTGAGLRAWGIAHGLAAAGHDVTLLMPRHALAALALPPDRHAELVPFTFERCDEAIARWQPDVVVVQHWWLATLFDPGDRPLVVDLHGPNLLETLYQNHPDYDELMRKKIDALGRADYITCAGAEQRKYFYPWLLLAGFDLRRERIGVVPVSLAPDLPPHEPEGEVSFVYGGIYLPWQNPLVGLTTLVERLEAHGRGRLHFYGGAHPVLKLDAAEVERLEHQVRASPRVVHHGLVSHDDLLAAYRRAHVAFDLMARNPERELAFTTRTVEYLWCGLPVVYNDYAELAGYIRDYEAGWTVDPLDRDAIAAVVDAILADPAEVARRSRNAQRLVRERLTWDRTIGPLDAFCREPCKRRPRPVRLTPLPPRPDPAALPPDAALLADRIEILALQAQAAALVLDAVARRPVPPASRLVERAKQVVKRVLAVDRRLRLAEHDARLAGGFDRGATHGQSFRRGDGALWRIDVLFATFGRLNPSRLRLHVGPLVEGAFGPDAVAVDVSAAQLLDNQFFAFVFPPQPPAPGAAWGFWLESPDATPLTTVAVWTAPRRDGAAIQRYHRGQPAPGQLVCRIVEHPARRT